MIYKTVSISLLVAIALGMSGCGGGDTTDTPLTPDSNSTVADQNAPAFAAGSIASRSIEEGGNKDIATYTISDESVVNFTLQGADANDFSLVVKVVDSKYEVTLKLKETPDFEQKENYNVTLVATDEYGNSTSKDITVDIIDKPFAFDVTGTMGSVIAGQTKELTLAVEEAKSDVIYTVEGANFSKNGNKVIFTAPAYVEGGNNNYIGLVTATDGDSTIELLVKASVIKDANAKPDIKNYLLKSQRDVDTLGAYTLYEYTYDDDNYLIKMKKTGTNIYVPETTTFEYSDDHKIMKGYKEPGTKLKSIRVFETKESQQHKFAADIKLRLSMDEYTNYMSYIPDTASLKNNLHLVKYINGLEFAQKKVELYAYNNQDQLSRVLTGSYTIDSDDIAAMTDTQLHTANVPTGGFPTGDTRLTEAQLNSLNSGLMPVNISHETTYTYDNDGKLTGRNFFGYAVPETKNDPVMVTYYANDAIKEITSSGVTIKYDTNSFLESVNDYKYTYKVNGSEITVTVKNDDETVTTYIFEEE